MNFFQTLLTDFWEFTALSGNSRHFKKGGGTSKI